MPFCIDAWVMKTKLEGASYCAERDLLDRMFHNSLTVWEKDLETEIREIAYIGVKHFLLVAFEIRGHHTSFEIRGTPYWFNVESSLLKKAAGQEKSDKTGMMSLDLGMMNYLS
jgi:hypothetical protein